MVAVSVLLSGSVCSAEDAHYALPLSKLKITKGEIPGQSGESTRQNCRGEVPKELRDLHIYYVAMPYAWVISLNENVIKRVIGRAQQRKDGKNTLPEAHPRLGSNSCLQADRKMLAVASALFSRAIISRPSGFAPGATSPFSTSGSGSIPTRTPSSRTRSTGALACPVPAAGSTSGTNNIRPWNRQFMGARRRRRPGRPFRQFWMSCSSAVSASISTRVACGHG